MPIRFSCSACGKKLRVKDEYAGRRSKCPACGWGIVVPFEPTWEESDSPAEPIPAPPPPLPGVSSTSTLPVALARIQTERGRGRRAPDLEAEQAGGFATVPMNCIMLAFVGAGGLILIAGFAFVSLRASGRKPIQPGACGRSTSRRARNGSRRLYRPILDSPCRVILPVSVIGPDRPTSAEPYWRSRVGYVLCPTV